VRGCHAPRRACEVGVRTRRAGVRVPSTSKRQMVFAMGRLSRGRYGNASAMLMIETGAAGWEEWNS
jgi:hypothetical protein